MKDKIHKLFEGGEFSQEFMDSVTAIIESELENRTAEITESLEAKYEAASAKHKALIESELQEAADQYIQTQVVPMVEKYLDYSVQEFVKENAIAIESGIKVELAESFLTGLSGLAEQYNVKVPEGQDNVIAEMTDKLEKAEQRLDAILTEKEQLQEQLNAEKMSKIVEAKTLELTESQREKFVDVVSKVSYVDEDQYTKAVSELYEAYFPATEVNNVSESVQLNEDKSVVTEEATADSKWLNALFAKI